MDDALQTLYTNTLNESILESILDRIEKGDETKEGADTTHAQSPVGSKVGYGASLLVGDSSFCV